jgi:hypothetical protein
VGRNEQQTNGNALIERITRTDTKHDGKWIAVGPQDTWFCEDLACIFAEVVVDSGFRHTAARIGDQLHVVKRVGVRAPFDPDFQHDLGSC